ncbi:kinase-like domain-containing protein [Fusarium redolens]|uniref:Kinase-like domain-containing protein n=1 Tax=Fusarium redolens TaxID=48865 RepID=A0A9P9FX48_FUSRE|nr:kinase-like domain-containing protein [Fusarium redolens]KAH7205809.1 kinase-like domain-containing protein [Fusarium redolens]
MRFVENYNSIPIPKIYCAFIHRGRSYIVMERIAGEAAGRAWNQRLMEARGKIVDNIDVANVFRGAIYDARLPGEPFWGPYNKVHDFYKALRNGIKFDGHAGRSGSRSVLTYGDLSSLNILVRGDKVVGIIDWKTAGWFPYYWEYARAWNFLTPMPYDYNHSLIFHLTKQICLP